LIRATRLRAPRRSPSDFAALAALLVFLGGHPLAAADGGLDPRFNGNGTAIVDATGGEDEAWAVAAQADGKVVIAGEAAVPDSPTTNSAFVVARRNADGTADLTFGPQQTGAMSFDFDLGAPFHSHDEATSVALQPDGRILVCGTAQLDNVERRVAVARLTADGFLDPSFGAGGRVAYAPTASGGAATSCSLLLRRNGKILLTVAHPGGPDALLQLDAGGDLDSTFGIAGRSEAWSCGAGLCGVFLRTVEMPDEKLLTLGTSYQALALARFDAAGSFDDGFGEGGMLFLTPPGEDPWFIATADLALDHHGRVLLMAAEADWPGRVALLRLRGDQVDPTFGSAGWSTFELDPEAPAGAAATALALQSDGKPIVAGTSFESSASWHVVVTRRTADGTAADASFSGGTRVIRYGTNPIADAAAVALSGGRLLVAGSTRAGEDEPAAIAVARLDNDLVWSDGFESGSTWRWQTPLDD
jgi:uncharacterized delta-60 repeat protein